MHWQFKSSLELKLVIWIFRNFFFLMYAQKWPLFFLKHGKKIPFLGYTRKIRELSIIPAYGGTIAWFALAPWFFRHFLHHQVSTSNGPKGKFVAKTWKYGQPTLSWKPTLSNLLTDIFRVYPKKRIFFPRFRQKKWPFLCMHEKK